MIETLHRLLPASQSIITSLSTLTADNVFKALDLQGVPFEVVRLGGEDWELESSELDDDEILLLLRMENAAHQGELLICTEACTRYGLQPFRCDSQELQEFVANYKREMLFDGDVIFLCESSRSITVYHHAGAYVHAKVPYPTGLADAAG